VLGEVGFATFARDVLDLVPVLAEDIVRHGIREGEVDDALIALVPDDVCVFGK